MSESEAVGLNHPYKVYGLSGDGSTKGDFAGGAYDAPAAVTIACTIYAASQEYDTSINRLVGVFDSSDQLIAVVGKPEPGTLVTMPE